MMHTLRRIIVSTLLFVTAGATFLFAQPALAQGLLPTPKGKCPENYEKNTPANLKAGCKDGAQRDYALDDVKTLMGNLGNWMLGISGAVALFVFVLGGFFWLISAGNSDLVSKGKGMMISAIIGLIIIFFSYTLITYGVRIFGGSGADQYIPKATGPKAGFNEEIQYSVAKNTSGGSYVNLCAKFAGVCTTKGKCASGTAISGACSASGDCCVTTKNPEQKSECGQLGGTCQANSMPCGGAYVKNLCLSGGANFDATTQCCLGQ